jgi:WD40 repeat protein
MACLRMKASKTGELKAHSAALYALAPGRTEGTIFSGGSDRVVAEWDLASQATNPFAIRTESTIYSLVNLGKQLAIGTMTGNIHIIDIAEKSEVKNLKLHQNGVFYMRQHPTQPWLYACGGDGKLSVWNTESWDLLWEISFSGSKLRRIAFDQAGNLGAIACGDGSIKIIETNQQRVLYDLDAHSESSNSVVFLPNGNLISGGKDAILKIWDRSDGFSLLKTIPAHNFAIYDLVLSTDNHILVSVSRDKTIKLWDANDIETPVRLDRAKNQAHLNSVNAALWLTKENILATCSDDRTVMLWKVE